MIESLLNVLRSFLSPKTCKRAFKGNPLFRATTPIEQAASTRDNPNGTNVPDQWQLAIRSPMRPTEGHEALCEWQLIAIHNDDKKAKVGIAMFWWNTSQALTEDALSEIRAILSRRMPHDETSAAYIAQLYAKYGQPYGPAEAIIDLDHIKILRTIPDGDQMHFERAINVVPDPDLEHKNRELAARRQENEDAFRLQISIERAVSSSGDDTRVKTAGVAVFSRPGRGTIVTVRTNPETQPENAATAPNGWTEDKLITELRRELHHLDLPPAAITQALRTRAIRNQLI